MVLVLREFDLRILLQETWKGQVQDYEYVSILSSEDRE